MRSCSESFGVLCERELTGLELHILCSRTPSGGYPQVINDNFRCRNVNQTGGCELKTQLLFSIISVKGFSGTSHVVSRLQMCWFQYWSRLNQTKAQCQFVICFVVYVLWWGRSQGEGNTGRVWRGSQILQLWINTKVVNMEFYSAWS